MKAMSSTRLPFLTVLAAALVAALTLSAVAGARTASTTITVKGKEFSFKLTSKTLSKPGKVTFVFKNVGHIGHDFSINGKKTPIINPGKTARLVVTFKKKGRYPYKCTVPGHAAAGMKGVFTVR
jgi:uncharacterized cupredoxin-like copper-binding protein